MSAWNGFIVCLPERSSGRAVALSPASGAASQNVKFFMLNFLCDGHSADRQAMILSGDRSCSKHAFFIQQQIQFNTKMLGTNEGSLYGIIKQGLVEKMSCSGTMEQV